MMMRMMMINTSVYTIPILTIHNHWFHAARMQGRWDEARHT
jgi:hypothetical protein